MISDKIRNMVCLEYDYLPLTLVKLVPLSRPVHVEMRGEMNSHWDSEHHKQVLNVKQTLYVGFPPLGQVLFFSHLPHPHSHIIYSWPLLPPRKITTATPEWSHAHICELTQAPLCVYQPSQSPFLWVMKAASLLGYRRATGKVLRYPSESYRLRSAHPENSWDQSLWGTFDLLKGPCTYIKLKTEWLIGCCCSHKIRCFMCKIFSKCDALGVTVGLMQVYQHSLVFVLNSF